MQKTTNNDAVTEYLMAKVIELKDRIKFLEEHIDKQNEIILKMTMMERNNTERINYPQYGTVTLCKDSTTGKVNV